MDLFSREQTRGLLYLIPILLLIVMLSLVIERDRDLTHDALQTLMDGSGAEGAAEDAAAEIPLKEFNPNRDSYEALRKAGLPTGIAVGIVRWRNYGKIFRIKEDLAEVSGMNDSIYAQIKPYIVIEEQYRITPRQERNFQPRRTTISDSNHNANREIITPAESFTIDTVSEEYLMRWGLSRRQAQVLINYRDRAGGIHNEEKLRSCYVLDSVVADRMIEYMVFTKPVESLPSEQLPRKEEKSDRVEINRADSAALVSVDGIGAKSAGVILRYRELLGGFYSLEQLRELKIITESNFERILQEISCDSCEIRKIDINFAGLKNLAEHPYISDRALRRIVKLRQLKGGWSRIEEMIDDKIFSEEEAKRLVPYLRFGHSATE